MSVLSIRIVFRQYLSVQFLTREIFNLGRIFSVGPKRDSKSSESLEYLSPQTSKSWTSAMSTISAVSWWKANTGGETCYWT